MGSVLGGVHIELTGRMSECTGGARGLSTPTCGAPPLDGPRLDYGRRPNSLLIAGADATAPPASVEVVEHQVDGTPEADT